MTQQIDRAAETLGLTVHDHIVVGQAEQLSFRAQGLL